MNKVFDLGQFDLDLTLRDASLDPLVTPTRRSLANASIGIEGKRPAKDELRGRC